MKELRNGIKIIGIDHGYGNIKTANTVTPTGITAYTTEPTFGGNILFYDGMYYRMGEGHKPFVADKSTDNDFYLFTLMAVARELSQQGISKAEVHIAAGLPLTWVKTQREDFRSYITRNNDVRFVYKEDEFVHKVIAQIGTAVEKAMPGFLAACLTGLAQPCISSAPVLQNGSTFFSISGIITPFKQKRKYRSTSFS